MSALPIGLQVSAELAGSSMAGTAASVISLFLQVGSVTFIVLMKWMKAALGSFNTPLLFFTDHGDRQVLSWQGITTSGSGQQ